LSGFKKLIWSYTYVETGSAYALKLPSQSSKSVQNSPL